MVHRDFTATRPGKKLVGDITYLPTIEGWWYLATVIDLATREVIGYAMAEHHEQHRAARRWEHAADMRNALSASREPLTNITTAPAELPGADLLTAVTQ